ncbi:TIGR04347 family pseudo-SAM/SPASM protein [Halorubraceae archaeon YAN]|nr:TIGR04347 family pseudo-SAM/SPASM protein [Halorubraceae archaeon YAN]
MISISKLLCELDAESDGLRYDDANRSSVSQISEKKQQRPVVVWNTTKRCNLYCSHCYATADTDGLPNELSTTEGKQLIDQLAEFGVPVLLFSGGEPLIREDLVELVSYAADSGIRPVLSTNGTLLTESKATALREAGLAYAGISVDGLSERNDEFRGKDGAFEAAVRGIEACLASGLKTGLRYTITKHNAPDLINIVDLLTDVGVDRFCFYHLDYGGRGKEIVDADLTPGQKRAAIETLCDLTRSYHQQGEEIETLLVGNYADAGFLVEYAYREFGVQKATQVYEYLHKNGGDPTGERIADVDPLGNVHLNQFWQGYSIGNVREQPFGELWTDESNPLLQALRNRRAHLEGRCQDCAYVDICRGGSRLRALTVNDGLFAPDPQCYLFDSEIEETAIERNDATATGYSSAD